MIGNVLLTTMRLRRRQYTVLGNSEGEKIMKNTMEEKSLLEQARDSYTSTMEDIDKLWTAYQSGEEEVEDLGTFNEYGLSFDYVAAGTFIDQDQGFFRYQISWGGPSEEFRYYTDAELNAYKVEFWYLDWNCGQKVHPTASDEKILLEIWDFFKDCGSIESELAKATE